MGERRQMNGQERENWYRMLLERAMTELDPFGTEAQFFRDLIASMVDRTK